MSNSVTVVDYGIGNLLSVARALAHCGAEVVFAKDAENIERAQRLLLPGVGAFADGMQGLRDCGIAGAIQSYARSGRPLLGICLGMQMLATSSEEFGTHPGLGIIPARVVPIPVVSTTGTLMKSPHIGWSELHRAPHAGWESSILETTPEGSSVYLVHSFHMIADDPRDELAHCVYGGHVVTVAVRRDSVMGCQFHPEKSGAAGLAILRRFIELS